MGIIDKKMETTIKSQGIYWCYYLRIMEKKMETTVM